MESSSLPQNIESDFLDLLVRRFNLTRDSAKTCFDFLLEGDTINDNQKFLEFLKSVELCYKPGRFRLELIKATAGNGKLGFVEVVAPNVCVNC